MSHSDSETAMIENANGFRHHPDLAAIFKATESRQLTEQELEEYYRVLPDELPRATAAREIKAIETQVVQAVINEVFALYPFEECHAMATGKCARDVRYVSAYATLAMLMNDPQWFGNKLLIWMKTIIQAFEFPEQSHKPKVSFNMNMGQQQMAQLKPHQRSIFDTYTRLKQQYHRTLSPASYALISPYLQQALDVLSED